MLPSNDGFLEVEEYVMNGPRYLICPPEQNPRVWIEDGRCVRPTGSDFLKRSKREEVRALSPQEYLDARFGKGETIFAGLGGRVSGPRKFLVLYYRIQQN